MDDRDQSAPAADVVHFILRVKTRDTLDEWIHHYVDGLKVTHRPDGSSILEGGFLDRAALFGMILLLRDKNIDLISLHVIQVNPQMAKWRRIEEDD